MRLALIERALTAGADAQTAANWRIKKALTVRQLGDTERAASMLKQLAAASDATPATRAQADGASDDCARRRADPGAMIAAARHHAAPAARTIRPAIADSCNRRIPRAIVARGSKGHRALLARDGDAAFEGRFGRAGLFARKQGLARVPMERRVDATAEREWVIARAWLYQRLAAPMA